MQLLNNRAGSALVLLSFLLCAPVLAQPNSTQDNTAAARALFSEGVELADHGQWNEAADRFRRSLALRDSAIVAFNLATALVQIGELVEASELFRRASRDETAPQALREAARHGLGEVQPRLGRLTVHLEGPRDRLTLRLDARAWPLEAVGVAAPADPGGHVLHALRADEEVASEHVQVPEGGSAEVSLTIPPLPVEVPIGPIAHPGGGDVTGEAWFWVLVIGGGALLVGAAIAIPLAIAGQGGPGAPIPGNLMPGVLEFGQ